MKVEFNTAANVKVADFSVNKGTAKSNIAEVVIAEDKKSATIELSSKLTEGTYTVTVAQEGKDALTGSVQVENERIDQIKVLSDLAPMTSVAQSNPVTYNKATVGYQVLNQYGEDITRAQAGNLTVTASGVSVANTTATATVGGAIEVALNPSSAKAGDAVALTIVDRVTAKVTSATVKLSAEAAPTEVTVGQLYNKDGKILNQDTSSTDKFYLPVELKDQYGKEITNALTATGAVIVSNSNSGVAVVGDTFESLTINGKETLVLPVTLPANPLAGSTTATVVVKTSGKSAQATVNVAAGRSIQGITLGSPVNDVVVVGESIKFPLTLIDNEGNEIKTKKELNSIAATRSLTNYSSIASKVVEEDGSLYYVENAPQAEGSSSVLLSTVSGKVATQVVTAQARPVVTTIVGIDSKKLSTNIREADVAAKTFNYESFKFADQYGRVIDSKNAANATLSTVKVKATTGMTSNSPFTINNGANPPEISLNTAPTVTATSDKITFEITHVGAALDATKVAASAFTQTFKVVKDADLATYSAETTENIVHVVRDSADDYKQYADKSGGTADTFADNDLYDSHNVTVYGTDSNNSKVKLVGGEYSVAYPSLKDSDFEYDSTTQKYGKESVTKEITVTINSTGEVIKVPVTYSVSDNTVIEALNAYESGTVANKKFKKVAKVETDQTTSVQIADILGYADITKTNKYGAEVEAKSADFASVRYTVVSGKATFNGNGTAGATISTAKADSVVKATLTTANGKTLELDIKFEKDVSLSAATVPASTTVTSTDGTEFTITYGTAVAADDVVEVSFTPTGGTATTATVTGTGTTLTATFGTKITASGTLTVKTSVPATATSAAGNDTQTYSLAYTAADPNAQPNPITESWILSLNQ